MSTPLSAAELDARIKLVDEHVQAEVDRDLDAIMRTWGKDPWFDDVAWEEKSYGRVEHREGDGPLAALKNAVKIARAYPPESAQRAA